MFRRYKIKKIIEKYGDTSEAIIRVNQVLSAIYYRNKRLLSQEEENVALIEQLEAGISTGGFYYFFWNLSGARVEETRTALMEIKSVRFLQLFELAVAQFPRNTAHKDTDVRQRSMLGVEDQAKPVWEQLDIEFAKYDENLHGLVFAYINENIDEFR